MEDNDETCTGADLSHQSTSSEFTNPNMEKVMTLEHDLEPRWILDETHSGSHFWRRETVGTTARVKFLKEVEIKEFVRWEFENDEGNEIYESNFVNVAMTLFLCVLITVMLPWYLVIGR